MSDDTHATAQLIAACQAGDAVAWDALVVARYKWSIWNCVDPNPLLAGAGRRGSIGASGWISTTAACLPATPGLRRRDSPAACLCLRFPAAPGVSCARIARPSGPARTPPHRHFAIDNQSGVKCRNFAQEYSHCALVCEG